MARMNSATSGGFQAEPEQQFDPARVPGNPALQHLARARGVLLLQGPVGPFFDRLTRWLIGCGAAVHRVAFQPGDVRDCRACSPIRFGGNAAEWPGFFDALVDQFGIDTVVLFGQSRKHHSAALERARARGVAAIVLEEGYVRPGFVTMEFDGVNALSRTLDRYEWDPFAPGPVVKTRRPASTRGQFWYMAGYACRHYWAQHWDEPLSKTYRHHRSTDVWQHTRYWLWSWTRKHLHLLGDKMAVSRLQKASYFFVPLQHEGDSQITHHSPYPQITAFISEVIDSFARHAPKDTRLVFKIHPHSRGGPSYSQQIAKQAARHGVRGRVVHLVEGHTPTLVEHARGVVLINSTVGLQALARNKPVAVLGDAVYKRPGLYFDGPLDRFWTDSCPPDHECARDFLQQLIALTQVHCNVYGRASEPLLWTAERGPM